jgi:predicted O-methyltransferase YrrM
LYKDSKSYIKKIYDTLKLFNKKYNYTHFSLIKPGKIEVEEMSTPPAQLSLMCFLVHITKAKKILEIGTFIGNTSMYLAEAAGLTGEVTTIEYGKDFYEISKKNIKNNNFEAQINLLHGDAGTILETLNNQKFDLIFIDGSKQDYLDFTLNSEKLISDSGVIVVDDVFFHGDALNDFPETEKGRGCKLLLDHYEKRSDLIITILPLFNGIMLISKA